MTAPREEFEAAPVTMATFEAALDRYDELWDGLRFKSTPKPSDLAPAAELRASLLAQIGNVVTALAAAIARAFHLTAALAEAEAERDQAIERAENLERLLEMWRESEASCCPEDVSFVDVIAVLRAEVAALKAERDIWRRAENETPWPEIDRLRAERDEWKQRAEATVELCAQGHYFGALHESHPRDSSGLRRCPNCMAAGIDVFKAERDALKAERDAAYTAGRNDRHDSATWDALSAERDALLRVVEKHFGMEGVSAALDGEGKP